MQRWLLAFVALCVTAANPVAAKEKNKVKQKSFEPVAMTDRRGYIGQYIGAEGEFWADVSLGPNGKIQVALYQNRKLVTLTDLELTGARLRGNRIDASGNEQPFAATFGDRSVNYDRSFGLLIEGDVRIGDDVVLNRLFYRRAAPADPPR